MVQFVKKTIGELFHFESSNAIYHAINVAVHGKREANSFPYVVRSSVHNGIKGYIVEPKNGLNSGNTISLAQDTGEFFYQEKSYFTGNKVKVLMPIGFELTKHCALYLMTAMQKAFYAFTWGSSFNTDVMKKVEVVVPVTDSGQLGVQYMEQYIKRIESQYIKRIESQYIKRIEAYLSVLGYDSIDDCELSSQDLKVLSGPDEWGEFRIGELFDKQTVRGISGSLSQYKDLNGYPVYGQNIKYQYDYKILAPERYLFKVDYPILAYASSTGMIGMINENFYRTGDNGAFQALIPKRNLSVKQILYFLTSVKMVFAGFNYNTGVNDVLDLDIMLPVHADGSIAYDYMNQYITAIEKKKVLKLKQAMDHKLELYREVSHQN